MKKILLFIAVCCCMMAFSGCTAIDFGKIGAGENDPAMAGEKVVATLHNHIRSSEVEKFDKYFIEDDDTRKMYNDITNMEGMKTALLQGMGDISNFISDDNANKWIAKLSAKYYGTSDYAIDNVVVDGDEVDVSVTMTLPDLENATAVSVEDINAIMSECFEFDINDPDALSKEMALRKGIDEAKLREIYSSGEENAFVGDIIELFSDEFNKCVGQIMDKTFENCPVKSYKIQYTVEKQADGAYKITDVDKN